MDILSNAKELTVVATGESKASAVAKGLDDYKKRMERFKNMKGSTTFVPYGTNSLIGVVHFSEEMHPRQYFHRVVVLDRDTYEVVRCSGIFCFVKASVEFCIGFRFYEKEETERIGFWISRMDRDPLYIEIDRKSLF